MRRRHYSAPTTAATPPTWPPSPGALRWRRAARSSWQAVPRAAERRRLATIVARSRPRDHAQDVNIPQVAVADAEEEGAIDGERDRDLRVVAEKRENRGGGGHVDAFLGESDVDAVADVGNV